MGAIGLVTLMCGTLAILLLLYAALHDLAARTLPDWLAPCVLAVGVVLRLMDHSLETGLIVALVTFVVLYAIWVLGFIGGGDVKFWPATALLIPPALRPEINFFMLVFLIGGLLGLIYLAMWPLLRHRRRLMVTNRGVTAPPRGLVRRALRAEAWRISRKGHLPYACAISAAAIISLWSNFVPPAFPQL